MALETYKKEKEKIAKEEKIKLNGGVEEEEKETLTTKEILADKEKSDLFGKMLQQSGDHADVALAAKLVSGTYDQSDFEAIEKHRAAFEKRMNQVENVNEELTPELVAELGEHSPDFKKLILNSVGSEAALSVVQERMAELSITDPGRFDKISKKVETMQGFKKGAYKDVEDSVKKIAESNKIDADAYLKALAIEDGPGREKALRGLIQATWGNGWKGKIGRFFDSGGALTGEDVRLLDLKKKEVDDILVELDKHKKNIGKVLTTTIMGNDEIREALAKATLGESTKIERVGMKESRGALPKEAEVDRLWAEVKSKAIVNNHKWDVMTDTEKDQVRNGFGDKMKKEAKKNGKGKGFWATLFDSIFGSFIDDKVKKLN